VVEEGVDQMEVEEARFQGEAGECLKLEVVEWGCQRTVGGER
jgi:hypothetical protein